MRPLGPDAAAVSFPLGGIGTGTFSIGARGDFRDWGIQNRPAVGARWPYTFFAIRALTAGQQWERVLEGPLHGPHTQSHGYHPAELAGLIRFAGSTFVGSYPIGKWRFSENGLPFEAGLEAFTPLVPLDPDASGIPVAVLRYQATNNSDKAIEFSVVGSVINPVGGIRRNRFGFLQPSGHGRPVNRLYKNSRGFEGVSMGTSNLPPEHAENGEVILCAQTPVSVETSWGTGPWFDALRSFWSGFCDTGRVGSADNDGQNLPSDGTPSAGAVSAQKQLLPGESGEFLFLLAWWFPNREHGWRAPRQQTLEPDPDGPTMRNHYASTFESAGAVVEHVEANLSSLEKATRAFTDSLDGSTIPPSVVEAVRAGLVPMRSNTSFRVEGGDFHGWEGTFDDAGSCAGTCTHVWSYAYSLAALFPSLERSARTREFVLDTDQHGKMAFRGFKVFDEPFLWEWGAKEPEPAADGQMGSIVRTWREWVWGQDREWLEGLWDGLVLALDYVATHWDRDGDGLMEVHQHNTYDIEFQGPNPLSSFYYLAALAAGCRLADVMHDEDALSRWSQILARGRESIGRDLFNGTHYVQRIDGVDSTRYQVGSGVLADQLLGQLHASLLDLGYLDEPGRIRATLKTIFRNNFRPRLGDFHATQRTFALGDDAGLVLCSWPNGGTPLYPFPYSDEVWTGVEYQVASHLIVEGYLSEGLRIVEAARARYDGHLRNPWDDVECGHHYARSMSSWMLVLALSGMRISGSNGQVSFTPAWDASTEPGRWNSIWSTGQLWGTIDVFRSHDPRAVVRVLGGAQNPLPSFVVTGLEPSQLSVRDVRS